MPLSEREQKVLGQIEVDLCATCPRLEALLSVRQRDTHSILSIAADIGSALAGLPS